MSEAPPHAPALSVIVPTYGREGVLVETLRSILAQADAKFELLVVDQTPAHEPATTAALEELAAAGRLRWIRESVANLPRARNVGVWHARGEIILFLDDDVLLPPGFLGRHLRHYAEPAVWGVGGRVVLEEAELTRAAPLPIAPELAARSWNWSVNRYTTPAVNPLRLGGCNFSIRRARYLELDGFNEHFTGNALGEDVDFFARARRAALAAGARIVYDPEAALLHLNAPAGGCREVPRRWLTWHRRRARNYYYALIRACGWSGAAAESLRRLAVLPGRAWRRLRGRPVEPGGRVPDQLDPGPVAAILAGPGGRAGRLWRLARYKSADWVGTTLGLLAGAGRALLDRRVTGHYPRTAAELASRVGAEEGAHA